MNRTTKINILAYASEPDKNFKYEASCIIKSVDVEN